MDKGRALLLTGSAKAERYMNQHGFKYVKLKTQFDIKQEKREIGRKDISEP